MLRELLDTKSSLSVMRAMSLACVLAAIGSAFLCILQDKNLVDTAALVGAFLVPAFAGKATQVFAEKK
jgi:hypothetical protein